MRDTCRCLQALILKALKIQWGHIYLEAAAAKDALQPNNNIPVNLGVVKYAAKVKTGWTCRNTPLAKHNDKIFMESGFFFWFIRQPVQITEKSIDYTSDYYCISLRSTNKPLKSVLFFKHEVRNYSLDYQWGRDIGFTTAPRRNLKIPYFNVCPGCQKRATIGSNIRPPAGKPTGNTWLVKCGHAHNFTDLFHMFIYSFYLKKFNT